MSAEVRVTDPNTGGQKGRKAERFDLIPFDALEEVARVYGFGATKYADDNWLKGYAWRLSAGALLRHVARWMLGEERDPESGLHHLAHAAWHCLTLMTFAMRGRGTDDRAVPAAPAPAPRRVIRGDILRSARGSHWTADTIDEGHPECLAGYWTHLDGSPILVPTPDLDAPIPYVVVADPGEDDDEPTTNRSYCGAV